VILNANNYVISEIGNIYSAGNPSKNPFLHALLPSVNPPIGGVASCLIYLPHDAAAAKTNKISIADLQIIL